MKRLPAALVASVLLACAPATSPSGIAPHGAINATVRASRTDVQVVKLVVSPGDPSGVVMSADPSGAFTATVDLPPGTYSLSATATDAQGQIVGEGQAANVSVVPAGTTDVTIRILDATRPPPAPDHGPILTTIVVSPTTVTLAEAVTLEAQAVDPDGQTITYGWTSNCGGTFGNAGLGSTTWSSDKPGVCNLTVRATSNSLWDEMTRTVTVQNLVRLHVTGIFVPQPQITAVNVGGTAPGACTIDRTAPNASCPAPFAPGSTVTVTFGAVGADASATYELKVDPAPSCGAITGSGGTYTWTAPQQSAVCNLTARVTNGTPPSDSLSDALMVAVWVASTSP